MKHNQYFEGKVQSLAYQNKQGKFSIGVMKAGDYTFGTEAPEKMTLVQGSWSLKLPGSESFKSFPPGQTVDIPGDSSFELTIHEDSSYICQYL